MENTYKIDFDFFMFENIQKKTRAQVAEKYRSVLLLEEIGVACWIWEEINWDIIRRFGKSGLIYIKKLAWTGGTKGQTIWVTRQTESGVVPEQVSRKAFWATSRVGFATQSDAIEHAKRCNEAKAN